MAVPPLLTLSKRTALTTIFYSEPENKYAFHGLLLPRSPVASSADSSATDANTDVETVEEKQQGIVYQYYFLILIVGVLVFIAMIVYMRRRRRQRKTTAAFLGRNALARDLESWQPTDSTPQAPPPNTARRWMQRYNRLGNRLGRTPEEDEHGLNELGEAPPPYKAREAALEARQAESEANAQNMPAVPLRTLSRNAIGKPPGYIESISRESLGTSSSDLHSRPISPIRANSSTPLHPQSTTVNGPTGITEPNQPQPVGQAT